MKKNIVVAYDQHRGIGAENDLLWYRELPADLRHFKELTTGHAIIMGRKTYESIGRVLSNRQNIIVSRRDLHVDGARVVHSIQAAYEAVKKEKEAYVMGGGEIYQLALSSTDRIYATEVYARFDKADVFFPPLSTAEWRETSRVHHEADNYNAYDYDFVVYERY